ncbi:hypothetical protein B5C34_02695 [Pacificimonas flava]|uniref:Uncharacterized protein n=2 Tax=Pacificimonas TaxID=1960290 RepID=A0A219B3T8_9SPHN|nr:MULTISPECIES: hypothetical protein [Pacificimonas]MBZ6377870.1 hypothetical protein [Pacificimonas aurantium]OWV32468.1 hypothetical protein B5C34_02695 [Pacificimonas flava]
MIEKISVEAREEEVLATLREELSPDELEMLGVTHIDTSGDPFDPSKRGEGITFLTVVIWVGQAAAGGIAYDLMKKAGSALIRRFGSERVMVDDAQAD